MHVYDELIGSAGRNFISAGLANDFIDGRAGRDVAVGGEGSDTCVNAEEQVDSEG